MFGRKKCNSCGEKINNSYNFCPYCRESVKNLKKEDLGLLGGNDFIKNSEIKLPMGFNTLFNALVKNLNKQFNEIERGDEKESKKSNVKKGGISISISTSSGKPPEIKVKSFGDIPEIKKQEKKVREKEKSLKLPELNSKKFVGMPKEEPSTTIRRFSNKVVYEINLPNVKSMKDISIIQLENSIEIKAVSKGIVFYKIIPISLPIKKYNFSKEKLVLELDESD